MPSLYFDDTKFVPYADEFAISLLLLAICNVREMPMGKNT
jgi:hypothetical protein